MYGAHIYCGIKWVFGYFLACMINKRTERKIQSQSDVYPGITQFRVERLFKFN